MCAEHSEAAKSALEKYEQKITFKNSEFKISKSTIRRDIQDLLLSDKRFKKIYGGIKFESENDSVPFNERKITNAENKILIAKKAAELVEDNDIIFIDFGTTVLNIVDHLKHIN